MTIDEAIRCERKRAEESRDMYVCLLETSYQYQMKHKEEMDNYKQIAEEHEQLAEWLEELKEYKATNYPRCSECAGCTQWNCDCANVRNKAIDDFVEVAFAKFTELDLKDSYATVTDCKIILREIAEQLNAEKSRQIEI